MTVVALECITSRTRDQLWTLDQVGNWELAQLDLDGDNNFNEIGEYNDDRTHNTANELTARDTDFDDDVDGLGCLVPLRLTRRFFAAAGEARCLPCNPTAENQP